MNRALRLLGFVTFVVSSTMGMAQQPPPLPAIVQQRVDDETLLVSRIDLTGPGIPAIRQFLTQLPGPLGTIGHQGDLALQQLSASKAKEVFVLVATHQLPLSGATVVIPFVGTETERGAIADGLKSIWPDNVNLVPGGLVVGDSGRPAPVDVKQVLRPEFSVALGTSKGAQVQIAVSPGADTRRTLKEFLPMMPIGFSDGSTGTVADGWQWLSLNLTPSPKVDLQFVLQAQDKRSAEALTRIIGSLLKGAAANDQIKNVLPKSSDLVALLTPKQEQDRIVLSLTEANGGAKKLLEEIASPLLVQMDNDAKRMQTINHLKHLMLAMHNYHEVHKAFPTQAVRSVDGKKLLSWRVLLLPWLDEGPLFQEFHLDEPWESEHNLKLVARMPDVFASSNLSREQRAKGLTTYLGAVADKTLFGSVEGIPIKKITDGTSNTIAILDANTERAVPWTQPQDLDVDLKDPLNGVKGQPGGMMRVGLCDGSVRGIIETISPETFRRLLQTNDGEVVGDF